MTTPFAIAFDDDHPFGRLVGVILPRDESAIGDSVLGNLREEERALAATLRGFRRVQFVGARVAWRAAADPLGCATWPLLRAASGAPDGPSHLSVSIAHKREIAVVLAGPRDAGALGVDVEDDAAAAATIADWVFDEDERRAFAAMAETERQKARVLAFSLKESIYKAHEPEEQRDLRYSDASIAIDREGMPTVRMRTNTRFDLWHTWRDAQAITAVRRSSPPIAAAARSPRRS